MKEHAQSPKKTQTNSRRNKATQEPDIPPYYTGLASRRTGRRRHARLASIGRAAFVNIGFVLLAVYLLMQPSLLALSHLGAHAAAPSAVSADQKDSTLNEAQTSESDTQTPSNSKILDAVSADSTLSEALTSESDTQTPSNSKILDKAANAQVPFIRNQGQIDNPAVKFYAQTFGGTVFVEDGGVLTYNLPAKDGSGWTIKETLSERTDVIPAGIDPSSTEISSFIGDDPQSWQSGVSTYNSVSFGEVYDGISLSLKAHGNNVEKIFVVQPGAETQAIWVRVEGAEGLLVAEDGCLEVNTALGTIRFTRPVAYQQRDGSTQQVDVTYVAFDNQSYGFQVGSYDPSLPLIIDPLLASTFVGGSSGDGAIAISLDSSGNVYIAGSTASTDYPTTTGAFDGSFGGENDAFVTKLNSDLTAVLASTFIGGTNVDQAWDLSFDATGNVYVTGYTKSADYPITPGAYDGSLNGSDYDVFITKLNGDLSSLLASTFIGGTGLEQVLDLSIDPTGNVYVTGSTFSADYPTTAGAYDVVHNGYQDGFVSKLNGDLTSLVASTFLGGTDYDIATVIYLDSSGCVYVGGQAGSADYPTTAGAYDESFNGEYDAFVSRLSGDLTSLSASTFVGGSGDDTIVGLCLDSAGNVYVAGCTYSSDYPTTAGAYDQTFNGYCDLVVSRLDHDLSSLSASTLIGGTGLDMATALCLDPTGNIYVSGFSASTDYPTTPGAYDTTFNGNCDYVVSRLDGALTGLSASTFIGGSDLELFFFDACLDSLGDVYIAGITLSSDYPTTPGAYDGTFNGGAGAGDAFVSRLDRDLSRGPDLVISDISWSPTSIALGDQVNLTATVCNNGDIAASAFDVEFKVDGASIGTVNVAGGLGAGASVTVSHLWTASAYGTHTITIMADSSNAVLERQEGNNDLTRSLGVYPCDLVVDDVSWSPSNIGLGQQATLTVTIRNTGTEGILDSFLVDIRVDGVSLGTQQIAGLSAGASAQLTQSWTAAAYGSYTVTAIADSSNLVAESRETNNEFSRVLGVHPADLVVDGITWPAVDIIPGDLVSLTATVRNAGTEDIATGFNVDFLVDSVLVGAQAVSGLGAGASAAVTVTWTAQSLGPHAITVVADSSGAVSEGNESNNELVQQLVVGASDLVIAGLSWSPTDLCPGDQVTLSVTVRNTGDKISGAFHVDLRIDGVSLGAQEVTDLDAGASVTLTSSWTAVGGVHTVVAIADVNGVIHEFDESNNQLSVQLDVPLPDFVVTQLTWSPAEVGLGDYVTLTATILNSGNKAVSGSFQVMFWFDGVLASQQVDGGLAPGASVQVSVPSHWYTRRTGLCEAKAQADCAHVVPELDETNNELSQQIEVGASDLVVTAISWIPSDVSVGDQVTFTATVSNVGNRPVRTGFIVTFEIDGNLAGQQWVDGGLAPGASATVTRSWEPRDMGTHSVTVIGDYPNNYVTELDETNNELMVQLGVGAPDLVVAGLSYSPTDLSIGDQVTLTATVQNVGDRTTRAPFIVVLWFDGKTVGWAQVNGGLAPGASVQVSVTSSWNISTTGIFEAKAMADYGRSIAEGDETNNEFTSMVPVTGGPDLVISSFTWSPTEFSLGDRVALTVTVRNIGNRPAGGYFIVGFEIDGHYGGQQGVSGGLAPGASATVTQYWEPRDLAVHTVTAIADPPDWNYVAESCETNNASSQQMQAGAPDLLVTSLSYSPTDLSVGDQVTLTARIQNLGNRTAGGAFTVVFWFDGRTVGTGQVNGGLAPGASVQVSATSSWKISKIGHFDAKARADYGGDIPEGNETNNEATCQVQVGAADLVVSDISWSPSEVSPGDQVTLTTTVYNAGTRATGKNSQVALSMDGRTILTWQVGNLGAGSSVNVSQTWKAVSGVHTVTARADVNWVITESNESNNERSEQIEVARRNHPPYKPTAQYPANGLSISFDTQSLALQSSAFVDPDTGDTFSLAEWQIREAGGNWSSPVFDRYASYYVTVFGCTVPYISTGTAPFQLGRTYYWRVRHKDNKGAWSEWSDEASFRIAPKVVLLVHGYYPPWQDIPYNKWKDIIGQLTGTTPQGDIVPTDIISKPYTGTDTRFVVYVCAYTYDLGSWPVTLKNPTVPWDWYVSLPWHWAGTQRDIRQYAGELSRAIAKIRAQQGVGKVDIVAHSLGGIVARAYIESADVGNDYYRGDVGKLVMLGTPNQGSLFALDAIDSGLINWLVSCWSEVPDWLRNYLSHLPSVVNLLPSDTAPLQLKRTSSFMRHLNGGVTGADKKVDYYVIAGNWAMDWDTVVGVDEVLMKGARCLIWDNCTHTELYTKPKATVEAMLLNQCTYLPIKDPPPQLAASIADTVYPTEGKSHEILISDATQAAFVIRSPQDQPRLTLTTPSGAIINPAVAETEPNVTYIKESDTTPFEIYVIEGPEQGLWTANVSGTDAPEEGMPYLVQALVQTDTVVSVALDKYQYEPEESINMVAQLSNSSADMVCSSIVATVLKPNGSTSEIVLYDDGLHNDGAAEDGTYANSYTDTSAQGVYDISVRASGTVNAEQFVRLARTAAWVEPYQDLCLDASDISFSQSSPNAGDEITITATIHNNGQADAENASILFYDGEPKWDAQIGEAVVTIPAGQAADASTTWAATSGDHDIYVVVSLYNTFAEDDYSNNGASKSISASGPTIVANAGGPYVAEEGSAIIFDASGSTNPDGAPLQYRWDFDSDGAWDTGWSDSPEAAYTWSNAWNGNVTVEVSDGVVSRRASAPVTVSNVAPTVKISVEQLTPDSSQVRFTGSYFEDSGTSDTQTILWDFGDGQTATDALFTTHNYAATGQYTVTLTITDDEGGVGTDTVTVTVGEVNNGVVAADDTYYISEGGDLDIGAPGVLSNDSDSALTAILVANVGNGALTLNADGSFTYKPNEGFNGTDSFSYKANDGTADSNVATVTIIVVSVYVPPTVEAGGDQTVDEGSIVTFSGSFTDPDSSIHTISWNFGDGSTASGSLTPTHVYGDNGIYPVTLTVTDKDGGVGTGTLTVTVNNVAPTVEAGSDQTAEVFNPVSFSGSFVDAGSLDTHTVAWDFGDGSGVVGTLTPTHTYGLVGKYTVKLTVTDDDGGVGTDTVNVQVIQKYAVWASSSASDAIKWSGSNTQISGNVDSNGGITMSGSNNTIGGTVYYVSTLGITGSGDHYTSSQKVSARPMPVTYALLDYQPGGKAATQAQNEGRYHYINGNLSVSASNTVLDGLYYVKGNVSLTGSGINGTFTIVAEGTISVSGSGLNCTAYSGDLLFFSNGATLAISGSNGTFGGIIYVPNGRINITGSGSTINGSLFADKVALSGSNTKITVR